MKYEILGPLRVLDGGRQYFVSARKVETLLAVLLIRAGETVTVEQLMNELWEGQPPRRATAALHVYVSQLRKFLARPNRDTGSIVTRSSGYLLDLGADELDLHVFQGEAARGRAAFRGGDFAAAATALEAALETHRGPALAELRTGPIVDGFVAWIGEERLDCLELLMEAYLALNRNREVIGRLFALIAEHPLRESFHRQLMLALYRSERQADALRVYQSARAVLNEELGLEPCRALRDLHLAILNADDRLLAA